MFYTSVKLFFFITDIRESINMVDRTMLMVINASFIFDMFLSLHTGIQFFILRNIKKYFIKIIFFKNIIYIHLKI